VSGLVLESVSFRYRGAPRAALEGVSFSLEAGKVFAVVGPNGSGKSTLLGLASGRLRPSAGRALFGGAELSSYAPSARAARVAALPQSERVAFDFSCTEFVLFARAHKRSPFAAPGPADVAAAFAALEALGVGELAERPVTELSGGEFQLVRLARCVAQEAALLVLDEPTAMLDPAHTLAVASAVRSIASSGKAVLLATHDLGFASAIADRALVLRAGLPVAEADPGRAFGLGVLERAFGVAFESRSAPVPVGLSKR
jgi:iron complex transport system ATP-binding protein